jgi:hypothetical protein
MRKLSSLGTQPSAFSLDEAATSNAGGSKLAAEC